MSASPEKETLEGVLQRAAQGEQDAWRSGVPTYETVAYEGLYDGIDLLTWGQRDSLKYEFHVAPGADPGRIRVAYEGVETLALTADVAIQLPAGSLSSLTFATLGGGIKLRF